MVQYLSYVQGVQLVLLQNLAPFLKMWVIMVVVVMVIYCLGWGSHVPIVGSAPVSVVSAVRASSVLFSPGPSIEILS